MKFFYSLIVYAVSIVITLSLIIVFVSGQSEELKIYTYYEGKFLVHYPSNYIVESLENTFNTAKKTFATSRAL